MDRQYATGDVLRRAYISLSAIRRIANWPCFADKYDLPSEVTDALNALHFQPSDEWSLALYVRAYKEGVEPYLPGEPLVSQWQRECPCQMGFWKEHSQPATPENGVGVSWSFKILTFCKLL